MVKAQVGVLTYGTCAIYANLPSLPSLPRLLPTILPSAGRLTPSFLLSIRLGQTLINGTTPE